MIFNLVFYWYVNGFDYGGLIYLYVWGGNLFLLFILWFGFGLRRGFGFGWIWFRFVGIWFMVRYFVVVKVFWFF